MEKYFVSSRYEDEPSTEMYNKADLCASLNAGDFYGFTFLDCLPDDFEGFPAMSAVIIKGNIITPKLIEIVTKYEVE